ncbi:MAG: DNA recombination protein RmuC [Actinomycetota bacterium]
MTALLPALTLLIGLAIGALVGNRLASRSSGANSLDVDRTRDIANATLATTMRELIDVNTRQQAEANARSAAEAVQQQKSVHDLVAPVGEQLARLDQKLNDLENKRVEDSGRLNSSIGSLSSLAASLQKETAELASAMKNTRVRGNWGELQLQRVIELAGMTEHVMYEQQEHIAGEGDSARPDMIVRLPDSKKIVIDAKAPMSAYLNSINATSDIEREQLLAKHAVDVMAHVNALAKKNYASRVDGSLDFIVMFVPGDTFLTAAFDANPEFLEQAIAKNVFPASPGTLIALLRAIAYGWRQEQLAENAAQVVALGKELYERVGVFTGHLQKVGNSLTKATESYNSAVASLETRVMPSARRFETLAVAADQALPSVSPIDVTTRQVSLPELEAGPPEQNPS